MSTHTTGGLICGLCRETVPYGTLHQCTARTKPKHKTYAETYAQPVWMTPQTMRTIIREELEKAGLIPNNQQRRAQAWAAAHRLRP